jgi:hypothetical protein
MWVGLSLVYTAGYWHLAVLKGRLLVGCVVCSALVIQSLLIPAYTWREKFSSGAGAAIQSASAAVCVVGLPAIFVLLTQSTIWPSEYQRHYFNFASTNTYGLQFGYVVTILLLSGIAGGTALGILRWRILQAEPAPTNLSPNLESSRLWWKGYLISAMPWAATVTVYSWLMEAYLPVSSKSYPGRNDWLLAEVLLVIAGLLFIAPMPLRAGVSAAASRGRRIWSYFKRPLRLIVIFAAVMAIPWFLYAVGVFLGYCIFLGVPCLTWAVLYERSLPVPATSVQPAEQSALRPKQRGVSDGTVVWITLAVQCGALFVGMLATAPEGLNVHGIGCLTAQNNPGKAYWFWQAYKGLSSEVRTENRMILRPSVDTTACKLLNQSAIAQMNDPKELSKGYVAAAQAWAWLIDPEEWESERTSQIRKQLKRLLGRDFSSYEELTEWWKTNGDYLAWSGTDELLEVREPEQPVPSESSDEYIRDPYVYIPFPSKRYEAPRFFAHEPPKAFSLTAAVSPMVRSSSWPDFPFYIDPEARLRGMKLDAAACIRIVTGEQQRHIQEYLHSVIGEDFSTYAEWRDFFAQSPRQNPWRMQRSHAKALITSLQQNSGNSNLLREKYQVRMLQQETGESYSQVYEFIEWLQNPQNTRHEEWENAGSVFSLYDDPQSQKHNSALYWLKQITGQNFDSPEQWTQWWQASHFNLALSADGMKLVSKRK